MAVNYAPNVPKKVSVDCIKCPCQINEDHVSVLMLLTTFFLQLLSSKYHVICAVSMPETALTFRQALIYDMLQEEDEHDFGQQFACYREKRDATIVVTFCSVTLLLVYMDNVGIVPLLWETFCQTSSQGSNLAASFVEHTNHTY